MVERDEARGRRAAFAIAAARAALPAAGRASSSDELAQFPNLKAVRWVQDEPAQHGPVAALRAQRRGRSCDDRRSSRSPGRASSSPVGRHGQAAHGGAEGAARPGLRRRRTAAATTTTDVLHRPRDRGAREAPGRRGGHPGLARRAAAGVHRHSTPSSRPRSSGSPPGWPGSTTPRTDVGYPPAPWQLQGHLWLSLFRVRGVEGRPDGVYGAAFVSYRAERADLPRAARGPTGRRSALGRRAVPAGDRHRHLGRLPRVGRGRPRAVGDPQGPVRLQHGVGHHGAGAPYGLARGAGRPADRRGQVHRRLGAGAAGAVPRHPPPDPRAVPAAPTIGRRG